MNGHTNGRRNQTCSTRTYHITPTTRAIRAALAISVTMLALGGSGLALAGTCTTDATTNTVSCDGAFTNLPGGNFVPVADLTLILGDTAPTSVTPAAGTVGVDASWGGNVGVITGANITTSGADGIHEYGSTSANFTNTGSITTNVSAPGAIAADISAYGDVTVVNNGPINAYSTGAYDVTAVSAYSIHGKVSVDNQSAGTITATAQDGNAIGVYASSYGDNLVSNEGTITANTVNGIAVGVVALAYKSNAGVTNSGTISATSTNYQAIGLIASSGSGYATVANSGTVSATGGQDQAIGIAASSTLGSSVTNSGHVYATSAYGESVGIQAEASNGTASITNTGSIKSTSSSQYQTAYGAIASSVGGAATITNSGIVKAINHVGLAVGLDAYSATGSTIANSGYVQSVSYVGNAIGMAGTTSNGDVNVSNGGTVRALGDTGTLSSYADGIKAIAGNGGVSVVNHYGNIYAASLHGTATGVLAQASGNVDIQNGHYSYITALSLLYGSAHGIVAESSGGSVSVVNYGHVEGQTSPVLGPLVPSTVDGIHTTSYKGTTVVNSGTVYAEGSWTAHGIATVSYGGTSITNTGLVVAAGLSPFGIFADEVPTSPATYGVGAIAINNSGRIDVTQVNDCGCNFNNYGSGIFAISQFGGDIAVTNSGSIAVNTDHGAFGINAYGYVGSSVADNSGSIVLSGSGLNGHQLSGEFIHSAYGSAYADNSGNITITTAPVAGQPYAGGISRGMEALAGRPGSHNHTGGGDAILVNTGTIDINSHFGYGMEVNSFYAVAGAYNSGTIVLQDDFSSVGILGLGGNSIVAGVGSVVIKNSGSVSAIGPDIALGIEAHSDDRSYTNGITMTVDNSGYVGAISEVRSTGIESVAFHDDTVAIDNSGQIKSTTNANTLTQQHYTLGGRGNSAGIHTINYDGGATITNSGDITASTTENGQYPGSSLGVFAENGYRGYPIYGKTVIANTGSISASLVSSYAKHGYGNPQYTSQLAFGPSNTASGVLVAATYGDIAIANAGSISANAKSDHYAGGGSDNGTTFANGISVVSHVGTSGQALNADDIAITNASTGQIVAYSESSDATGDTALANGISARVVVGSNAAPLVSAGHGITIDNAGIVSATAVNSNDPTGLATATGIFANNGTAAGYANVTNSGSIAAAAMASGVATATGISATGYSIAATLDTGYVGATATGASGTATGVSILNSGTAALAIGNAGTIKGTFVGGSGNGYGANITTGGDLSFTNSGAIVATATNNAVGVTFNNPTATTLVNSGLITATSTAAGTNATATGASLVNASADGSLSVTNSGGVLATASTYGTGIATATGILASAPNIDIALDAGGYVGAASTGTSGTATALSVIDAGTTALAINNAGAIKATFTGAGNAYGATITSGGDLSFTNAGQTFASSGGNAVGITLNNPTSTTLVNSGAVGATATATSTAANATAISLVNGSATGSVNLTNSGSVLATASTSGAANATGILASAQNITVALNAGDYIGATATGSSGTATALSLVNAGTTALAISNPSTIKATFNGAGGLAYGANITSAGDVNFTNAGQVFAANVGDAVGLQLNSATSNTLANSGLISAASSAGNSIAVRTNDATATLQNTGIINGAIVTGAGNDTFTNSVGGVWNPIGTSTDFGAGDDTISNAGTINLNNSAITLGSGGNAFSNSGTIASLGSNAINVGAGNAFTNTGSVEMRNGLTGDALTLTGNWAGSGQLGLDVSPLHGSADMLHIVGNVAAGSATTINVNLLDLPTTATGSVPVVDVTGDSVAGSFVLGDVHFNTAKSFLVVQAVDLTSKIDTSNATPDVFSVGVAVTGVTDSGALAASIVPGVESLMNSEVGTWRQRMGVLTPTAKGTVGLWTRAFDDSGTVNPGHLAGNFGQDGNFSFDQTNSGEEIGADFAITENFSAGLMLGKAQGSQHLDGTGVGRNRISGDTRGAYLTWMTANGFYVDGSYRSMSFDARLDSQVGESRTTGNADAFNIEVGQAWSFGDGFKLTPQVQYTRTTVDKADTLSGALAGFTPQGGTSSRGRAGVTLSDDIPSGSAVWTPYASLSAVHEFDGQNDFLIDNTFSGTTDTKGTSALVEGGVNVKVGKFDAFAGLNYQSGGALKSFAGGQVGLRYSW